MAKLILVTGGARSGKSSFAESLAKESKNSVVYIATSIPFDEEMKARIKKHTDQRPKDWETIEAYKDLDKVTQNRKGKLVFLLDCITIMVSNIMLESCTEWDNITGEEAVRVEEIVKTQIDKLIKAAGQTEGMFILVTNEIGMGIVPENKLSRLFRDIAGRVNQTLAAAASEVYFCVSGIPVKIK